MIFLNIVTIFTVITECVSKEHCKVGVTPVVHFAF